jgi:hypothetical protein
MALVADAVADCALQTGGVDNIVAGGIAGVRFTIAVAAVARDRNRLIVRPVGVAE